VECSHTVISISNCQHLCWYCSYIQLLLVVVVVLIEVVAVVVVAVAVDADVVASGSGSGSGSGSSGSGYYCAALRCAIQHYYGFNLPLFSCLSCVRLIT
jgi:hypothetical protein